MQIRPNTQIGKGFYIGHFGNIVISPNAVIGDDFNISQGVTIGKTNRGERNGSPSIGNKVSMGANAVIDGAVKIGNNVLIAPNSFVNFDVPEDSVVVTHKCKLIASKEATTRYIWWVPGEQPDDLSEGLEC